MVYIIFYYQGFICKVTKSCQGLSYIIPEGVRSCCCCCVRPKFCIQLALPISPEIMDKFWCSRHLNDCITLFDRIWWIIISAVWRIYKDLIRNFSWLLPNQLQGPILKEIWVGLVTQACLLQPSWILKFSFLSYLKTCRVEIWNLSLFPKNLLLWPILIPNWVS